MTFTLIAGLLKVANCFISQALPSGRVYRSAVRQEHLGRLDWRLERKDGLLSGNGSEEWYAVKTGERDDEGTARKAEAWTI